MKSPAVIGLITQLQETQSEPDPLAGATHRQYLRAVIEAGATPLRIPLLVHDEKQLRSLYEQMDGLFLTGGADVDPVHYGEGRHLLCEPADPARDQAELLLFRWAREEGKPILGICRGMQLINVGAGGTLYQDLAAQRPESIKHDYFSTVGGHARDLLVHDVHVEAPSRLEQVLDIRTVHVNSMHHQGIRQLAPGLKATAFAPDGLIEGVEGDGQFLVGVQWHPEELTDNVPVMRWLFAAFVQAAEHRKRADKLR